MSDDNNLVAEVRTEFGKGAARRCQLAKANLDESNVPYAQAHAGS